jgi:PAS domain-containing protein
MGQVSNVEMMDQEGYERLCQVASTHRKQLVIRLCGDVGLRPDEIARLRPGDVRARVHDGELHHLLAVRDEHGGTDRDAYLPATVERDLRRYIESASIAAEDPVFDVSPRRIQMLVAEVTETAAEGEDDPLASASTADLRRRYARRQLRQGVPPSVVMAVGGWRRLDGFTGDPDGVGPGMVTAAFAQSGAAGDERIRAAFDALAVPALLVDTDGAIERVNDRFVAATSLDADAVVARDLAAVLDPVDDNATGIWETALSGDTWRGTVACRTDDGDCITGDLALSGFSTRRGPGGFIGTFRSTQRDPDSGTPRLAAAQERMLAVGRRLSSASTREGVATRTCAALVESDPYQGAWLFETPVEAESTPLAGEGDETPTSTLAAATLADETVTVNDGSVAVPCSHGGTAYGALVLDAGDPVSEYERRTLAALGSRVAGTLAAVEWKRLLLADAVLELELKSDDRESLFVGASGDLGCTLSVVGLVPLDGDSLLYYVEAEGCGAESALEHLRSAASSARLVAAASDEALLEVTGDSYSLAGELIARGANVTELTATNGTARLTCETAPNADIRELVEGVAAAFPSVRLLAKREIERSVRTQTEFQQALEERLTDRQRSVLQAAYHAGYFDWPRGSTAEELADSIGVSSPTLHNHLRRAQRKLLAAFFDEQD